MTPSDRSSGGKAGAHNARLGIVLCGLYVLVYFGFIYLNAFHRDAMAADAIGGVNLAIIYGFGLIIVAFVLALVYMALCRNGDEGGAK